MKNQLFKYFFALLSAFLILIILLFIFDTPENVTGGTHPTLKTMSHSGESVVSLPHSKWFSYLFGLFSIGIFVFCLFFSYFKKGKLGKVKPWLIYGSIGYFIVFSLMIFAYWNFIETGSSNYFGGYPAPTAWMLYGVWFYPVFFAVIYYVKFDDWVLKPEELNDFQELVKENRKAGL